MKYLHLIISLFICYSTFGQRGEQLSQDIKSPMVTEMRDRLNNPTSSFNQPYPVSEADVFYTKEVLCSVDLSVAPNNRLLHIKTAKDTNRSIISVLLQALAADEIHAFANIHDSIALNQNDVLDSLIKANTAAIKRICLLETWQYDPSIKK